MNKEFNAIEKERKNLANMPDQKKHQIISFIKSGIRIVGYILLPTNILLAAGLLLGAELVIGILEEMV